MSKKERKKNMICDSRFFMFSEIGINQDILQRRFSCPGHNSNKQMEYFWHNEANARVREEEKCIGIKPGKIDDGIVVS